jgi:hypothetical protein
MANSAIYKIIDPVPSGKVENIEIENKVVKDKFPTNFSVKGSDRLNDTTHFTKLYKTHTLYNKHQLYLGYILPSDVPPLSGCIENSSPTLYSVIND